MQEQVQEYFEAYFGGTLNESTSDEEIMEAVYDLVALRDAVCDAVGLNEGIKSFVKGILNPGEKAHRELMKRQIDPEKLAAERKRQDAKTYVSPQAEMQQRDIDGKKFKTPKDSHFSGDEARDAARSRRR